MNDRHLRPVDERHTSVCVASSAGCCVGDVESYLRPRAPGEKFDVYLSACDYHFANFGFDAMGFVPCDLPDETAQLE